MPDQTSLSASLPDFRSLKDSLPGLASLTSGRALTSDVDGSSNSGRAAGSELITRALASTTEIDGLGGKVDLLA